ncbi:manganese transport protein [Cruoricaptor ignavus]|uniref:Divalent metal cation transporter MntH n=1 Tax=Cruoricaptor ignavus TaxID=1118202 RepID=A0A1M6A935_9FLAO|nr:Nramp family divalent metal transporter [Cruoricaptor ignavus]QOR74744.1 Nramp family divalent metal transporter [Cruoricaptor ignavus]SHI33034.1 manganese transport protein [Cruoricaptor ignavus]
MGGNQTLSQKLKTVLMFTAPGLMVAVGYMDPGNWATDIEGGAKFGYTLLSVIFLSNIFAMFLQHLCIKLGIATGLDLAQSCRAHYSKPVNFTLWILCEIAITACDLAEVIGTAIALNLLFGIPLVWGIVITGIDVLLILMLQRKGFRPIEIIVAALMFIILMCFGYELFLSKPDWKAVSEGIVPTREIYQNREMLYIGIGILGATVMPHNLYLHSHIIYHKKYGKTEAGKKSAIKYATWGSNIALIIALFINSAILIVAASTFHFGGHTGVAEIQDAYLMLGNILDSKWASIVFGVALLASGLNSTLTGTLAGQIVMEGFMHIRLKPWLRRLLTRLIAIVPALIVAIIYGESGTNELLILSQVILSMQLSFAVVPLVQFTGSGKIMGVFKNSRMKQAVAIIITAIIIILNLILLLQILF